jgi:ribosomal protein S18 acetylase RimI-like enzyme
LTVQGTQLIQPPFRRGTVDDIGTLSEFIEIASEGLAIHLWRKIAGPAGDPWSVGRDRVRTGAFGLSYENAVIAQADGRPTAGLISYALDNKPATSEALPAVLMPLQELMNEARDTWYVHVLAAYPEYRGRGQGTALLRIADGFAEDAGKHGLSLIVSDTNVDARRLYERCGYMEVARRSMVKEDWQHPGVAWLLLAKKKY